MKRLSSHFQTDFRRDSLAVVALFILVLIFLGPGLLPGRVLLPLDIVTQGFPPWQPSNQPVQVQNFMLADAVNYIFPTKQFAAATLRDGTFPLWNPYVLGGYPFTYNTQAGLFYPLSLFYYLLPATTAVNLVIVLQMWLGALFMYLYLRHITTRRLAAMTGAALFIFNGLMVIWLEWQVVYAAVIWLPLQLYLAERMVRKVAQAGGEKMGREGFAAARLSALLAAITVAFSWLGGHWNWTLYASMTLGFYLLWRLWPLFRQAPSRALRLQIVTLLALPLGIGLALSLVQVGPAFFYLSQSHRQPLSFAASLSQGLLNRLVALLVPNFFGAPQHNNWWGAANSNYVETTFFTGILTLLLGGLAPFLRRDAVSKFFMAWGSLGLLWTLGTPIYGLLYVLPIFNGLFPSRAAFVFLFCLAVLAAISLDQLMVAPLPHPKRVGRATLGLMLLLLAVAAGYFFYYRADVLRTWAYLRPQILIFLISLLVGGGLLWGRRRGWLRPRPFGGLALCWLIIELWGFGYGYNVVSPVTDLFPVTPTETFLQADPELFRIVTLAEGIVYPPNTSLVPRLHNISGYEPGILRRIVSFVSTAEGENAVRFERVLLPLNGRTSPLLDLLNVKYIVTTNDLWDGTPTVGATLETITTWQPLVPGASTRQTFTMPEAGLHRLDVSLQAAGDATGMVTLRVFTADGQLELAHSGVDVAQISGEGWTSFYFEAFPSEWGREFYFGVEWAGAGEVRLGAAAGDNELAVAFVAYYLPRPRLRFEDGKTRIYENEGYFPRAFAVPQAVIVADEAEALANVVAYADRLDELVVLELEGQPSPPLPEATEPFTAQVEISNYALNEVTLTANMPAPGFVVLADTYYPGWQATLDGEKTPVYRADSMLRAVYVPAGQHTIHFAFRPLDFIVGGIVSGLTLLVCVGLILLWVYLEWGREKQTIIGQAVALPEGEPLAGEPIVHTDGDGVGARR